MDLISISKADALASYGGNGAALARALGISRQAVHAMPDGPLQEGHALKLYFVLKPDHFQRLRAANDDVGPAREEHCDGIAATSVDVEGAQGAEAKVHVASMEPLPGARYVRGDAS